MRATDDRLRRTKAQHHQRGHAGAAATLCSAPIRVLMPTSTPTCHCHPKHPQTGRHGPNAARACATSTKPPVPRRAPRGIPTTRAVAGPRRRRTARAGARATHPTPSQTAEFASGDLIGRPRARVLAVRAGATGATACRWGLDRPPAAVWTPISLSKVAGEGPGVRHTWRADDDACPSTNAPYQVALS